MSEIESAAAFPPSRFWDFVNARPVVQTPAAAGLYQASTLVTRDQGTRVTCVGFALVAAIELRAWRQGIVVDLSEQHACYLLMLARNRDYGDGDERIRLLDGAGILRGKRLCLDVDWKYVNDRGQPPETVRASARYSIEHYFVIPRLRNAKLDRPLEPCLDGPGISNTDYLEVILAQGYDIAVAICLTGTNVPTTGDLEPVLILCSGGDRNFCLPTDPKYWHAVLITGYVRLAEIPYFVCRDSLPGLSHKKPLLISYDYMRTYAEYGVVVTGISIGESE